MRGDQSLGVRLVDANRLFHHDVKPRLQGGDADRCMRSMWRRDENRIDGAGPDQVLRCREKGNIRELGGLGRHDIGHSSQFQPGDFIFANVAGVNAPHGPETDNANADVLHRWAG